MARIPTTLDTDDLPLAELCAARIDGDLSLLQGVFIPIDEPDVPALRASALAAGLDPSLIVERRSAAWVHGLVAAPPRETQLCRPSTARGTANPGRPRVRELAIDDDDLVELGGVRCTSHERTAFDLLRDPEEPDREVEQIVGGMLTADERLADRLRARLKAPRRLPHRGRALARLERALAWTQPSATR